MNEEIDVNNTITRLIEFNDFVRSCLVTISLQMMMSKERRLQSHHLHVHYPDIR